ncbi:hypothetical protein Dimus_034649 [Dionaea muscipula]
MSDGAEESKSKSKREGEYNVGGRAGPDDYGRAVARVAVAQVCKGVGFERSRESALEALSDIAIRFLCDLGNSASSYSSLAGRAECNVFDIVKALEDLGSTSTLIGFPLGQGHYPIMGYGVVNEIMEFVEMAVEIPFAQPIPRFPVVVTSSRLRRRIPPSFSQMGETGGGGKHVPDWLPAFPDQHTYVHSPVWNDRKTDPQAYKVEQARQRRKAERSLLNLQQRLLLSSSSSAGLPSGSGKKNDFDVVKDSVAGEKKHGHGSVLEIFAPAIDAMKKKSTGVITESMGGSESRVLRPGVVHFRLEGGRKVVSEDLDVLLSLTDRANEKKSFSLGMVDEKDDKKRRAEMILRQSVHGEFSGTNLDHVGFWY